jgi:hypothetical protein
MPPPTLYLADPSDPSFPPVDVVPLPLFPGYAGSLRLAFWFMVSVISMGNNTKLLVGSKSVLTDGLFSETDFMLYDVPDGFVFDASKYYIVADVDNTAVVAVSGMYPPQNTPIEGV